MGQALAFKAGVPLFLHALVQALIIISRLGGDKAEFLEAPNRASFTLG